MSRHHRTPTVDGWIEVPADDSPNPVVAERYARDGGIARRYANGMVDAIDGEVYGLSPGFTSYGQLDSWIAREQRRNNP